MPCYELVEHGRLRAGYGRLVTLETGPGSENHEESPNPVQGAVDATAAAYREHNIDDVMDRLRSELSNRGAEIDDDAWLSEVAGMIRAGLPLVVGESEDPRPGPEEGRHRTSE